MNIISRLLHGQRVRIVLSQLPPVNATKVEINGRFSGAPRDKNR